MAFRIPQFGSEQTILDDVLGVLRRRKLVVALAALATLLGAYGAMLYITEQYEAEAKLLIMLGRENTEAPITVERGAVYASGVQKEEINSYIQLLASRRLIEDAVDQVGVEQFQFKPAEPKTWFQRVKRTVKSVARAAKKQVNALLVRLDLREELSDRDKAVEYVKNSLSVSREGESNVIRIALRLPSADLARTTVQAILNLYLERHVQLRQNAKALPIFDQQVGNYRQEIASAQKKREEIQSKWSLSDVPTQRAEMLRRLHRLRSDIDAKHTQIAALQSRRSALRERLASIDGVTRAQEVIEPNPSVQTIKDRLVDLRLKRVDLASRYEPDTPPVLRVDEEIAALERLLAAETQTQQGAVTMERNPLSQSFEEDLERVGVQLASLDAEIAEDKIHASQLDAQLQRLNKGEALLQLVDLDLQVLEKKFITNSTRREEARINEELDRRRIANVAVLSPPTAPPFPVYPKKLLIMGLALIAGLLIGGGLGMLLEWGDDTIYGKRELARATSLPYLGEFQIGGASAVGDTKRSRIFSA